MKDRICWLILLLFGLPLPIEAGQYELRKVSERILVAVRTPLLEYPVEGNVTILVNDRDLVLVDSPRTPDSARKVVELIRAATPKPVRYLINTHWHGDHHHGNAVFQQAFPGLEIIGSDNFREEILTLGRRSLEGQIFQFRNREVMRARLEKGVDESGLPLSRVEVHRLRQLLSIPDGFDEQLEAVSLTPPGLTYHRTLELYREGRTIRIQNPGNGNTRGDSTIYLPEEKVLISGDLLVETVPFMSLSYPYSWLERLEEVAALELEVIIPGHGEPMRDRVWLERHIRLLRSLRSQLESCLDRELDLESCRGEVDLGAFRQEYSAGVEFLQNEFDYRVTGPAVRDGFREGRERRYGLDATAGQRLRKENREVASQVLQLADLGSSDEVGGYLETVRRIDELLDSGRWQLALPRLQDVLTSLAGSRLARRAEVEHADLESLHRWYQEQIPAAVPSQASLRPECSPRLICGLVQDSANRGQHFAEASLQYGKVAGVPAGAYYVGVGSAFLGFAGRLSALQPGTAASSPLAWDAVGAVQELEERGQRLYFKEKPGNPQAIRANAVVKEVRELISRGWQSGALLRALEARRLQELGRIGEQAHFELEELAGQLDRAAQRILTSGSDHSIAEYYLLLARQDLEDAGQRPGRVRGQLAAAVLDDVLPFYFRVLKNDEVKP